jgi:hypothetical protein
MKVAAFWSDFRAPGNGGAAPDGAPQSTLLITICAGRSPAGWIDPVRPVTPPSGGGTPRRSQEIVQSCSDPFDLDIWFVGAESLGGARRTKRSPSLGSPMAPSVSPFGQLLVPPGNQPLGELGVSMVCHGSARRPPAHRPSFRALQMAPEMVTSGIDLTPFGQPPSDARG